METTNIRETEIGWIGTGNLGTPICAHLLGQGAHLTVHDIDTARTAPLADRGAKVAGSVREVAGACDVVFSAMPSDQALRDIADGPDGLAACLDADQAFVDISTVSPGTSAEVAGIIAASGAPFLRATVSGSTAHAESGTLGMYCSGPREAFDALLPVLQGFAAKPAYCGGGEEARILKLLVNIIVIATPALVGEALAFGRKSGLEWAQMIDAIANSVGASPVINYKIEAMKNRDWTPAATIDLVAKDLTLALEWGRENDVPMPFASLVRQLSSGFQASGDGDKDFFYALTWPERLMGEPRND